MKSPLKYGDGEAILEVQSCAHSNKMKGGRQGNRIRESPELRFLVIAKAPKYT
ncbi:hypothetical protein GCM10027217_27200 [Pseudomaricurvus hydrocarbonicus]